MFNRLADRLKTEKNDLKNVGYITFNMTAKYKQIRIAVEMQWGRTRLERSKESHTG